MKEGILLKDRFALIDALDLGEYLEIHPESEPLKVEVRRLHG
jgi:hypothetical protein